MKWKYSYGNQNDHKLNELYQKKRTYGSQYGTEKQMKKIKKIFIIAIFTFCLLLGMPNNEYKRGWHISWEEFSKGHQKIGLALGGGSVLGAAHIGVLKALDELGISIDYIAGTSIGAFVSGLYAFGLSWEEIEKIANNLNWVDISGLSFSNMGLLQNKDMGKLIIDHIGDVNLEDANIPLAMIATDIVTMEKVILTKGNLAKATMASTCIPGVFTPVEINDRLLVDGGIVENVPISPLINMGAKLIIAVNLNTEHKNEKPENIVDILLRTFFITSATATKYQTQDVDILIAPDLSEFNVIDIEQSPELIEKGYTEALRVLKEYFK